MVLPHSQMALAHIPFPQTLLPKTHLLQPNPVTGTSVYPSSKFKIKLWIFLN